MQLIKTGVLPNNFEKYVCTNIHNTHNHCHQLSLDLPPPPYVMT